MIATIAARPMTNPTTVSWFGVSPRPFKKTAACMSQGSILGRSALSSIANVLDYVRLS
ncbi:MAG: hypothetical protein O2949_10520 [Proteobacteria bacterium]|nr:hypothetical protein [Pseudomonadota bacterium]